MGETTFIASSRDYGSSTYVLDPAVPTGVQDGDLLVAVVACNDPSTPDTVPSGFTLRGEATPTADLDWVGIYTKIASSESGVYEWTWGSYDPQKRAVVVAAYRGGFDIDDPIDVVSNTEYAYSNTTIRAASMTTSADNEACIWAGAAFLTSSITCTAPSGFDEDIDTGETSSDLYHFFYHDVIASAGATGDIDGTLSTTTDDKHAFAIALNPVPVIDTGLFFGKGLS